MKTPDLSPKTMKLSTEYMNKLLGTDFSEDEAGKLLEKMRFSVKKEKGSLTVRIPPYRTDILHPIDLVEDVAIAYGYDRFEPEMPRIATVGCKDALEEYSGLVRELMIGLGFQEVMTLIMTGKEYLFDRMRMHESEVVETEKPVSSEHSVCRSWLLPSLLSVLEKNRNREYPQKIFETGDVILADGTEKRKLAGAIAHSKAGYSEIKAALAGITDSLGTELSAKPKNHPSFIEGRCAQFEYGFFGEIHPEVLSNFGLEVPVAAFEIDAGLLAQKKKN